MKRSGPMIPQTILLCILLLSGSIELHARRTTQQAPTQLLAPEMTSAQNEPIKRLPEPEAPVEQSSKDQFPEEDTLLLSMQPTYQTDKADKAAPTTKSTPAQLAVEEENSTPVAAKKPDQTQRSALPEFSDPDLFSAEGEPKNITLNFEGAELKNFIDYIADIRGMNIIPDKSVAGNKISLNFRNPVSKSGAWNAFVTILDLAGFSVVRVGMIYKVLPKDKKLKHPLPTFIGVASSELPDTDMTIRYLAFLNNISVQDVQPLLAGLLSNPSTLIPQPNVNGFIIIDKAYNIKSAMKVIQELDQTGLEETVVVMRLNKANAVDVKAFFDGIMQSQKGQNNTLARLLGKQSEDPHSYFDPSTKLIAEERTNSLFMMGTKKSIEKVQKIIIDHIDTDLREAASPLRIVELQNTNAADMVEILREVTSAQNIQSQAGQQAANFGAVRGGVKFFKKMLFQPDKEGNRLIVSCADDLDWQLLQKTIKDLDKAQPQVAINMMVVSISADKIRELGGQLRSKTHNQLGNNVDFQTHPLGTNQFESTGGVVSLLGNLLGGINLSQGSTLFSLGKVLGGGTGENGLWGVFKALQSEVEATLLSQPFLLVTNRTKGSLVFGESVWITTQQAVSTSGTIGDAAGKSQVQALTTINVLPQINMEGIMRLDIDMSMKDFVPGTGGNNSQEKKLTTNITVANGQVIALGGFVRTKVSETGGESPIFSSIPLLGWLTKNKKRTTSKEYLFVFLCPTIIKPRSSPGVELYTKIKLHEATNEVEDAIQTKKTNDPVYNWFFNPDKEDYSHKVVDYANARYQPSTVDIQNDPYYRSNLTPEESKSVKIAPERSSPQEYVRKEASIQAKTQPDSIPYNQQAASASSQPEQRLSPEEITPLGKKPEAILFPPAFEPESRATKISNRDLPSATEPITPSKPVLAEEIDAVIAQRRAQLKQLLAGSSLSERLLTAAPTPAAPESEKGATLAFPPESTPEPTPAKTASSFMSRRAGLKSTLAIPTERGA